ncbi:MAG: hypothetical protein J3Q66DRAFT_6824 [Benniella sp.]|nr:MAG: hypothetical protein J3Q66DRAFT_6824 [Benniella sp.]
MARSDILQSVFVFLDRPSLLACLQVSRLWRDVGRPIFWQTQSITTPLFMDLFCEADKDERTSDTKDRMQDFFNNCSLTRSLTIADPSVTTPLSGYTRFPGSLPSRPMLEDQVAGLQNLVHLAIRTPRSYSFWDNARRSRTFYRLVGKILSQNPGIRELEWEAVARMDPVIFFRSVFKHAGRSLRRLSLFLEFDWGQFATVRFLLEANNGRQWLPEKHCQQIMLAVYGDSEGMDDPINDSSSDGSSFSCRELEELELKGFIDSEAQQDLELYELPKVSGVFHIRSLILIDFLTIRFNYYPSPSLADPRNDSLLAILVKCPNLEKLCVTYDVSSIFKETSSGWFRSDLKKHYHCRTYHEHGVLSLSRDDFVDVMRISCPRLREIEFGLAYLFTTDHWNNMMEGYGQQLESFSIWGDSASFDVSAFVSLVTTPALEEGQFSLLTRLNINGMEQLHDCAWKVLQYLPRLKEFRARDVYLDARKLIMEDGWICKDLEVLEIFVMVPYRGHHDRCRTCKTLVPKGVACCDKNTGITYVDIGFGVASWSAGRFEQGSEDDEEYEYGHSKGTSTKRQRLSGSMVMGGPKKKAKTGRNERQPVMEPEPENEHHRDPSSLERYDMQIKVCEMIGRLTRLRELRIEGSSCLKFKNRMWSCLKLKLESGLDRLAPLQQNLEKLIVSTLHEELSGRKEVEWIARNWVHHQNRQWLEQHASPLAMSSSSSSLWRPSNSRIDQPTDGGIPGMGHGDNGHFAPRPKFKELIGVSQQGEYCFVEEAESNIEWLKEQCPSLTILESELDESWETE